MWGVSDDSQQGKMQVYFHQNESKFTVFASEAEKL